MPQTETMADSGVIDNQTGTLTDVEEARSGLRAAVPTPWWVKALQGVTVAGSSVAVSLVYAGTPLWSAYFWALVTIVVFVYLPVAVIAWSRRRLKGVHLLRRQPGLSRARVRTCAMVAALIVVATILSWLLPRGCLSAYLTQFVLAVVVLGTAMVLNTRMDPYGRPQHATERTDELIRPRGQLRLCAVLAGVEELSADLLAAALHLSAAERDECVARLAQVNYACTRPDPNDPSRQWVSLTWAGRAAYGGHLRALLD
jgi:hypothetical protein